MSYAGVARRTTRREAYCVGAYGGYRGYGYGAARSAQRLSEQLPTAPAIACRSWTPMGDWSRSATERRKSDAAAQKADRLFVDVDYFAHLWG
jgi:hypothetical protein